MKKYALFILAGLLCFSSIDEAQAKAYKLGRAGSSSGTSKVMLQPGTGTGGGSTPTFCSSNCVTCSNGSCTKCANGYLRQNGSCVSCPTGAVCNDTITSCKSGYYFYGNYCHQCPSNGSCAGGTSGSVTCNAGYYSSGSGSNISCTICEKGYKCPDGTKTACSSGTFTNATGRVSCQSCTTLVTNSSSVCCSTTGTVSTFYCASGYRKSGSYCVSNCEGVTCASGYTKTVTANGCECQGVDNTNASCDVWSSSDPYAHYWNANGSHTIPDGKKCWLGYGANATITVPAGSSYSFVGVRFWEGATVTGSSFSVGKIHVAGGSSATGAGNVTFAKAVTANRVEIDDGIVLTFSAGLSGNPTCSVADNSSKTCSCTSSKCSVNTSSSGSSGSNSGSSGSNSGSSSGGSSCHYVTVTNCGSTSQMCGPVSNDYGASCTSGSQCSSGLCAPCGMYTSQGSSCR